MSFFLLFLLDSPYSFASEDCLHNKNQQLQACQKLQQSKRKACQNKAEQSFQKCHLEHEKSEHKKKHQARKRDPVKHAVLHYIARSFIKSVYQQNMESLGKYSSIELKKQIEKELQTKKINPNQWESMRTTHTEEHKKDEWELKYQNANLRFTLILKPKGESSFQVVGIEREQ